MKADSVCKLKEKFKNPFVVGLSGTARAGKDTFCSMMRDLFARYDIGNVERVALADKLKSELDPFFKENFAISAFTQIKEEKDLIRPMLVAYGKIRRVQSKGTYWTRFIEPQVNKIILDGKIPVITDIRYGEYPEDEVFWAKNKMNGKLIHIERHIDKDGVRSVIPPANEDEAMNDSKMIFAANYHVRWETTNDKEMLENYVINCLLNV